MENAKHAQKALIYTHHQEYVLNVNQEQSLIQQQMNVFVLSLAHTTNRKLDLKFAPALQIILTILDTNVLVVFLLFIGMKT